MRSEFILAFNEICEERGLAKETVFEALETALVSAYRRDMSVSNTQEVAAQIDQRSGDITVWAEKEVVDSIMDSRTEVLLEDARVEHPEVELGEIVMVISTPKDFGRIAAQTAKQVILQRVREAEREQLYEEFTAREGELVNGTVQSISGQHITIGLGRTEAILPRNQQVRGERYRAHDKIRVFVLEVRRTNRGPQIIVSRNHRSLLRRLLELEVPEIYNGQVDIKSIAREAGERSKVAVSATQPGVDPVGACVGMRGVRIQSIVRELNDEKIDVIEYDVDQKIFISKALSPARVSQVYLEDHPDTGKTAIVIVPDDQLSLAIGREGQNARLAAKLTGWRIDIKSLTEAANECFGMLTDPAADQAVAENTELHEKVNAVLEKRKQNRPITAEDFGHLNKFVDGVIGRIINSRVEEYDTVRKERAMARAKIPAIAWDQPLEELGDLPMSVYNALIDGGIENVGDVLYRLELGDEQFLNIDGIGDKALEGVKSAVANYRETLDELVAEAEAKAEEEAAEAAEIEAVAAAEAAAIEAESAPEPVAETEATPVAEAAEPVVEEEDVDFVAAMEDLSKPLVKFDEPEPEPTPEPEAKKPPVKLASPTPEDKNEEDSSSKKKRKKKGTELILDEESGRVVTKRKRKRGGSDWGDFGDEDIDYDF